MNDAHLRSPRDDPTTDDYSSSSDESQPSTSDCSPDRDQQQPHVPSPAPASDRYSAQQRRPNVPMLGLKLQLAKQQDAQLPTSPAPARQQKAADTETVTGASGSAAVPTLQLSRSMSRNTETGTDRSTPGRTLSRLQSQRKSSRQSPTPLFTIQLASDALTMNASTFQRPDFRSLSKIEAVKQHCATELGIRQSAVKVYQLQEVSELSDGCTQLAIAVEGSDFTLGSYEEMVRQNKQFSANHQQSTVSLIELRDLAGKQQQELSRNAYHIAELEADKRRLSDQYTKLQQDAVVMRDSLQRANQAQMEGQTQVRELKAEFDRMNSAFMQNSLGSISGSEGMPSRAGSLLKGSSGSQSVRSLQPTSSILIENNHQRLHAALERLSDQQCLTSLEQLPQLLEWLPKLSDQISMLHQAQRPGKQSMVAQKDHSEHRD